MWSSIAINGSPKLLIVDASYGVDNWESLFGIRLFKALNRRLELVGENPLKIKHPEQFQNYEEHFHQSNCIFLFVQGGLNDPSSWSRLLDYWEWLNANVTQPKLFFGCAWENYHPQIAEAVLNEKTTFAPIALIPKHAVTAREIGLFCIKFFAELGLHSNEQITGKMAWFSASKAKEFMKRRGLKTVIGLRC